MNLPEQPGSEEERLYCSVCGEARGDEDFTCRKGGESVPLKPIVVPPAPSPTQPNLEAELEAAHKLREQAEQERESGFSDKRATGGLVTPASGGGSVVRAAASTPPDEELARLFAACVRHGNAVATDALHLHDHLNAKLKTERKRREEAEAERDELRAEVERLRE